MSAFISMPFELKMVTVIKIGITKDQGHCY